MATTIQEVYVKIAEAFAYSKRQIAAAAESLGETTYDSGLADGALKVVVDVTTESFTTASVGLSFELEILAAVNGAYVATQNIAGSGSSYLAAVRALNNYITTYVLGTVAAAETTIDDFIQSCPWNDGLPSEWVDLCTEAGFTVNYS